LCEQGHRGVAKLALVDRGPVTGVDLSVWESKSSGCILPEDLKALLHISDGLTLKWDANLHGEATHTLPLATIACYDFYCLHHGAKQMKQCSWDA